MMKNFNPRLKGLPMLNRIKLRFQRVFSYGALNPPGRFLGVLAVAFVLWTASCGIKAPPVPPHQIAPPAVSDLQYRIADGTLILNWSVPAATWARQPEVSVFVVYRSKTALEKGSCKNCPLLFERVARVPVVVPEPGRSAAMRMRYREKLLKGYRYIYKVVSRTATDISSKDSNLVTFNY